ncbi:MAG: glycosyltransferase family 2 protein [Bryobacteraceae bacterium]|nr:glycosyltransferase family 2 protein [Bryobacteraceae bacterium]
MNWGADGLVALIIPAYNEAPVIGLTLQSIPVGLFDLVVVADNGSSDATGQIARSHGAQVVRTEARGYGVACLTAIAWLPASVEIVVFLQADLSEDVCEADRLIRPIAEGRADLVLGSRVLGTAEAGSLLLHQRFGNLVATLLIRLLYGHSYTDLGPFRAIRRSALDRLGMRDRTYGWTVEMQVRALENGLRVLEVPVSYRQRAAGENKVSGKVLASLQAGWRILTTVMKLRLRLG